MRILRYGLELIEECYEHFEDKRNLKNFVTREDFEGTNLAERIRNEIIERDLSMPWCETVAVVRRGIFGGINFKIEESELERISQLFYEVGEDRDETNASLLFGEISRTLKLRRSKQKEYCFNSDKRINSQVILDLEAFRGVDINSKEFRERARLMWKKLSRFCFFDRQSHYSVLHTHNKGSPPSSSDKEIFLPEYQSLVVSYRNPDNFHVYSVTSEGEEIIWP